MPGLPQVLAWTLGVIGAVLAIKLFNRESDRINAELDQARTARVTDPDRARMPTLQRDPRTGVYRPDR